MSTAVQKINLAVALFGETRRCLLSLFFLHPESSFYLRQITKLTGKQIGSVQRELANLTNAGIIKKWQQGNLVLYQVVPLCPIHSELKGIIAKTFGVADIIRSALEPLTDKIKIAFIYGSFANQTYRNQSDVDVMIIGTVGSSDVIECLAPVQDQLVREINTVVMGEQEFRQRLANKNHFLISVLSQEKTFLIGDKDELGKLA